MNNGVFQYQLSTFTGLTKHSRAQAAFLRDAADAQQDKPTLALEAQVRSGDYFVTLAMTLDSLGKSVENAQIRASLEDVVSDLIHLQDNYTITKDNSSE